MPNESGMISEEIFLNRSPPEIGIEGLRRHRGEKVVVDRDGRRCLGVVRDNGTTLESPSTGRPILKVQGMDYVYLPVNGRNGMYMRKYIYFQLL